MYKPTLLHIFVLLVIIITLQTFLIIFIVIPKFKKSRYTSRDLASADDGTCSKDICGAVDPVNDPDYNVRNVIKQSILLEEHIAEVNKYCISCIIKHFQHIIGLMEEAVWLAGARIKDYPMLEDSPGFYQQLFDLWSVNRQDDLVKKQVLDMLRERRRKLIETYYIYTP